MHFRFHFEPYRHRFKHSLQTSQGVWKTREGILLCLVDEREQSFWGEIAPIPWFGSETLEQAFEFCRSCRTNLTTEQILSIPDRLPACQFGFESALERSVIQASCQEQQDVQTIPHPNTLAYSRLLPAGKLALTTWKALWNSPGSPRTFKWKVGVYAIDEELAILDQLVQLLPEAASLRLDANGGLTVDQAKQWLQQCDRINATPNIATIEYLEQPLPPQALDDLLSLSDRFTTLIALDESVANLRDLQTCYDQGWRDVVVIKPAIVGSPSRLRQFCQTHAIDAVFSTAFETAVGRHAGLWLAAELGRDRAVGYDGTFDTFDYFE